MTTNPIKLLTLCKVATIVLLSSCSSKFGSKREAENVKLEFLSGGKEVVVVRTPTDEDYEREMRRAQNQLEDECRRERTKIMRDKPDFTTGSLRQNTNNRIDWAYSQLSKAFVEQSCNSPVASVDRDAMVRRDEWKTRKCFDEFETKHFVCEERRTNKDEMSSYEWAKLKTHYTYFRY